jgi:hypothetical protein
MGPESVTGIPLTGLMLWVERLESSPEPSVETTLRHHAVVKTAWRHAPACLPVRFGQWFATSALLEERIRERGPELELALARVAGAGEHGVRVVEPSDEGEDEPDARAAAPASGRAYLESVQRKVHREEAREERARTLAQAVEAAMAGSIRAQRMDLLSADQGLVSLAHLVGREREKEYGRRVTIFERSHGVLRFIRGGPWPPYSFAP